MLREMKFKYQSTHTIIIAGDFSASFIRHYKDTQDDLFKHFCQEMQLKLPHDYPTTHTYHQGDMTSQIDYILLKELINNSRSDVLLYVEILKEGINTSDHFPVITDLYTTLKIHSKCQKSNVLSSLKWENVDKENYKQNVTE